MSFARHRHLTAVKQNQISFFGFASRSSNGAITPPAGMRQGDLVFVYSVAGSGSLRSLSISPNGGQSWTATKVRDGSVSGIPSIWISHCTFNGTWSANPTFTISGSTVSFGHTMCVFRPGKEGVTWVVDQGPSINGQTNTPTHTLTGITNTQKPNVTIFVDDGSDDFTGISGAGWNLITQQDYGGANAQNACFVYQIQGWIIPLGATGNVDIDYSSGVFGTATKISFYYT